MNSFFVDKCGAVMRMLGFVRRSVDERVSRGARLGQEIESLLDQLIDHADHSADDTVSSHLHTNLVALIAKMRSCPHRLERIDWNTSIICSS